MFATTRRLAPFEGLTIAVGWPKGLVTASDGWQRIGYQLRDAWPAFVGVGGLLLLLLYHRSRLGSRARPPKAVPVPTYEAPAGSSPASLRYLDRMGYDDRCFAAAVLQLAIQGQLTIDQAPRGLLGGGGEYTLSRKEPPAEAVLSADERVLLDALFADGQTLKLANENHAVLTAANRRTALS